MWVDAKSSHFFLYGRQDCDDSRERVLVFCHQSADVVNVSALSDVVLDVALDVLQPHVEDSQRSLDRVELRHGQQLDMCCADHWASRRMRSTSIYCWQRTVHLKHCLITDNDCTRITRGSNQKRYATSGNCKHVIQARTITTKSWNTLTP